MNPPSLSKRLMAAASFVREGAIVADVGTDHAYLPIYLVLTKKAKRAIASDINKGPYLSATANVKEYSLEDKIETLCVGGLCGIDSYEPTDILICGMGGELISDILAAAPFVKNTDIRLILQPMTHSEILRGFLLDNGFSIIGESLAKEEDRIYQIICAEYSGNDKKEEYDPAELLLGRLNIEAGDESFRELLDRQIRTTKKIKDSKLSANADASEEEKLLILLEELKNEGK